MTFTRALVGLAAVWVSCSVGCANQKSEQAAPAASPNNAVQSAPVAPESQYAAPAAAPAPALDRSKSAEAARDDEFQTLEAAERALDQAKADLDRLALAEPTPTLGGSGAAEKKDSKRGGAPAPAARAAAADGQPGGAASNAQCESACKAFASLTRAANAVCRLDGDGGSHCAKAKKVVTDSSGRVAACTCPAPGQ